MNKTIARVFIDEKANLIIVPTFSVAIALRRNLRKLLVIQNFGLSCNSMTHHAGSKLNKIKIPLVHEKYVV